TEKLGREPTREEIGEALGVTAQVIGHWQTVSLKPTSLDAPISSDDAGEFSEIIGDDKVILPFDRINDQQLKEEVGGLLDKLDRREREILKYRYGLRGAHEETLEDVGKRFKITRERVRQIQNEAITKLRVMMDENERIHARIEKVA
ncbi:MAG TPA: sigma-70 family RNA polymerase sigma factor, partial [Kiritimatiellia bacterium]